MDENFDNERGISQKYRELNEHFDENMNLPGKIGMKLYKNNYESSLSQLALKEKHSISWEEMVKSILRRFWYMPDVDVSTDRCRIFVCNCIEFNTQCVNKLVEYKQCMERNDLTLYELINIDPVDKTGYEFFRRKKKHPDRPENISGNFSECSRQLYETVTSSCISLMRQADKEEELKKLFLIIDHIIAFQTDPKNLNNVLALINDLKEDSSFINSYNSVEAHEISKKLRPYVAICLFIVGALIPAVGWVIICPIAYNLYKTTPTMRTKDAVVKLLDSAYEAVEGTVTKIPFQNQGN